MKKLNEMYKCDCGTVFEIIAEGKADQPMEETPQHCEKPTKLLKENVTDGAKEKHVPVIEKIDGGYKVKIGSVPHPMTPEHWIVAIELLADGQVLRQNLTPTDKPEAIFYTKATKVKAREYCNLHGLWVADN